MEHIREFSKHVQTYDAHTHIQKEVAKKLIAMSSKNPKRILDLGSGTGEIWKNITWPYELFMAVDYAQPMCKAHPLDEKTIIYNGDFESIETQCFIQRHLPIDHVYSSSALQWASDIDAMLGFIKDTSQGCSLAIFTAGTFKTLYNVSKLKSFLPQIEELKFKISKHFNGIFEEKSFIKEFDDKKTLFEYLKKSGVSGGKRKLGISETKRLIQEYPHLKLEFEVLFFTSI